MVSTFVLSSLMTQLRKAAVDRMRVSEWPRSIAADSWQYAAAASVCYCYLWVVGSNPAPPQGR
jgi:hypothetical protein